MNFKIEADSKETEDLMTAGIDPNNPHRALVEDSKLLSQTGSITTNIYKDDNQCTDHLARLVAEQDEPLVITEEAPASVRYFVL